MDKEQFFEDLIADRIDLVEGLTPEKIQDRSQNLRITDSGIIQFEMERHPPLSGTPIPHHDSPIPARWHVLKQYRYNPESDDWSSTVKRTSFDWEAEMYVDLAISEMQECGLIRTTLQEHDTPRATTEALIWNHLEYLEETAFQHDMDPETKRDFIGDLVDEFREQLPDVVRERHEGFQSTKGAAEIHGN